MITIDGDGLVESFNKAATRMFGYTPDQAIGRNASMLMADPERAFPSPARPEPAAKQPADAAATPSGSEADDGGG